MTAEIITVGTELLLGDILNTNARFLAKELAALGIGLYAQTVVGDNGERLSLAIKTALERADLVLLTGGLGATDDDITRETAAEVLGLPLIYHEEIYENIVARISRNVSPSNKRQAYVPEGAVVLHNQNGTAPGLLLEQNEKKLILLPGPPKELEPLFTELVFPFLAEKTDAVIYSETVRLFGIGESAVGEAVQDLMQKDNPSVAPYAKDGDVILRITARAKTKQAAADMIAPIKQDILSRFPEFVYGFGEETLPEKVLRYCLAQNLSLATAESCTAGMIAATIGDMPGVSDIFAQGFVTYSNEAKEALLGVPHEILATHGAVSSDTARAMAEGVCKKTSSFIGISATGIAGPGGGTAQKPVGLVYIGVCIGGKTSVRKCLLKGDRSRVRRLTVLHAFDQLRKQLQIPIDK